MAAVTVCSDSGAQAEKVSLFPLFPHLLAMKWWGWMPSPTWWTWVWVSSESLWWTRRPGMLHSMGSQRVGHDWTTELNRILNIASILCIIFAAYSVYSWYRNKLLELYIFYLSYIKYLTMQVSLTLLLFFFQILLIYSLLFCVILRIVL